MKNAKPANIFPLLRAVRHPISADVRAFEQRYGGDDPDVRFLTVSARFPCIHTFPRIYLRLDYILLQLDELHERIGDCMLRKTKAECLDLPPKIRHLVDLELSDAAQGEYLLGLEQAREIIANGPVSVHC